MGFKYVQVTVHPYYCTEVVILADQHCLKPLQAAFCYMFNLKSLIECIKLPNIARHTYYIYCAMWHVQLTSYSKAMPL